MNSFEYANTSVCSLFSGRLAAGLTVEDTTAAAENLEPAFDANDFAVDNGISVAA